MEIGLKQFGSQIVIWTEKEVSGQIIRNDNITTGAYNTFISFRLKVAQSGDVFFEYNFGNGWITTWSSPYNINWAPGYPMGESEKLGDGTQMTSHHRDMMYITQGWGEAAWGGMTCVQYEAPGWSWRPLSGSNNDWDVIGVGGPTCAPA